MALRPRILLGVPSTWDVPKLKALSSAESSRDVIIVDAPAKILDVTRRQDVSVVVIGWPLGQADVDGTLAQLRSESNPPLMLLLHPPGGAPSISSWHDAGFSAALPWSEGIERDYSKVLDGLVETRLLKTRLAQSEAQYTDLLQNTRDAIYILGPTRFTFVNRAFEELMGFSAQEICSPSFDYMRLIAPESRPMILERARLAAQGIPLPPRYEFMALNKAGLRLDVAVSVSYIVYQGEPSSLGVLQDITARKQYEKALLRRNRELAVLNDLAATVSRAPDLSTVLEMAVGRLIAVMGFNAAGISLLDSSRNTVQARLYRGMKLEDVNQIREVPMGVGLIGTAARTGDVQVVHDLAHDARVSPQEPWAQGFKSAVCVPIQAKDRVLGSAIGLCVDPREFAPEELSLLLSIGHQLGTAVERASLYDRQEASMQRLLALDEVARALSSTLDHREVYRVAATQLQRVLSADMVEICLLSRAPDGKETLEVVLQRTPEGHWDERHSVVSAERGLRWKAMRSHAPVFITSDRDADLTELADRSIHTVVAAPMTLEGASIGAVLVGFAGDRGAADAALEFVGSVGAHLALASRNARMFSDLEQAYSELKETKDKLVLQEKLGALGEMSAGVAHDFNNVLGAILGRTQLLKTAIHDSNLLKSLDVIERAALDGAATVRRIQEFSRVGGSEDFHPVSLDDVVTEAVEMTAARWRERARAEGLMIDVVMERSAPPLVMGNAQELREVLTNLIHNACDAMPQGGRITVSTGIREGRCHLRVQDTGTGMPPEVRARVFDPFFTTKGVKGTGLGLSVSYGIVQRHHGEFDLESEPGKGTTFTIWMAPAPAATVEERPAAPSAPITANHHARVLIIDDEEPIRDVLADMLRAAEHEVEAAEDGPTGLKRLDELMAGAGLDVVFTDLGMPGMSGWEVATAVKQRFPGLPVGLITGWGATLDMDKMKSHGVDLVVPKPFKFDQVTSVVAEALQLGRQKLG